MINNISNYLPRTEIIVDLIKKYNIEGKTVIILSDIREHLNLLYE